MPFFNEILWLLFIPLNFVSITVIQYFFGERGLFGYMGIAVFLANIQTVKVVQIFGLTSVLGTVTYSTTFLITDLLTEIRGKEEAKRAVLFGLACTIISTYVMYYSLLFIPYELGGHEALSTIFVFMPRIAVASVLAYLVSQLHDVWAFHFWKEKTKGKYLWLRNNLSTMVSQFIDTSVFCSVAFWGVMPQEDLYQVIFTMYLFKLIIAISDTPFVYLGTYIQRRRWYTADSEEKGRNGETFDMGDP
ncbi:VUT family protein [Thermococci archaeon]|nr:MAG: VUT family protein [Thermococci archaeon]